MNDRTNNRPTRNWSRRAAATCAAVGLLVLCSCSGRPAMGPYGGPYAAAYGGPAAHGLPPQAFTGAPGPGAAPAPLGPPGMELGVPLPYAVAGPWAPPGVSQPWPKDEYVADGGDAGTKAGMTRDVRLVGLEAEDTVAYFDTLDGRTLVEPSNRVQIYSPRFMAVRQVVGVHEGEQMTRFSDMASPEQLASQDRIQPIGSTKQNLQSQRQVGQKSLTVYRSRQGDGVVSTAINPRGFHDGFMPFENFAVIRTGIFDQAEMAWLARGTTAAITWESKQAVQVTLGGKAANALVLNRNVETLFTVGEPPANPKLRIVKVASSQTAQPGETVGFTLRFDNVGNQPIGNVTIVDHLSPRLEFVDGTAEANVKVTFSTHRGEDESLMLRFDATDPLRPGQGGIVRFQCRMR